MNKKGYIIDLGRVLANFDLDIAFRQFLKFTQKVSSVEEIKNIVFLPENKHVINSYELGEITPEDFYNKWSELLELQINYEVFFSIWSSVFTENKDFSRVLDLIKDNKKVILSNIDPIHWNTVSQFDIVKNYFNEEDCIRSYKCGMRKPDTKIYELAVKKLNNLEEIIYIDDVSEYIDYAQSLGIKSVQYDCRFDTIEDIINKL